MFRKLTLAILIFALSACQAGSFAPAAPTLTPAPTQTPTSTPTPTPAFTPTPEPAPEFTALQEKIAQSKDYTLMSNGSLEYQSKDGVVVIPGITVNPQTGEMTFTQNDQTLAVDEASIAIDEKDRLTFQTEDGELVITITPNPIAIDIQTPTPERTFEVCKPVNLEAIEKCVIYDGDSIPEAITAIKQYQEWLTTLSEPFDETKLKLDVPLIVFDYSGNDLIIYDSKTAPNFPDPATRPFRRDITAGIIYIDYGGGKIPYLVRPIEFYDKNDPQNNKWVVTLKAYGVTHPITGQFIPIADSYVDTAISWDLRAWKNHMNTTPILTTPAVQINRGSVDPLVQQIFSDHPEMQQRFERFLNGDVGALSDPGIAVLTVDWEGGSTLK